MLPLHMGSVWEMFAMALKLSQPVTAVNLTRVDWMLHTPRSRWSNVFWIGAAVVFSLYVCLAMLPEVNRFLKGARPVFSFQSIMSLAVPGCWEKKIRGRQTLTLTTSRYLWLGHKTASSWTAGHQSLTWGINFPLLSLLLIFTIVHWLSLVMAFTLGTLRKDAPGGWFRNDSWISGTYLTSSWLWESKRSILHSQDNQALNTSVYSC